MRRSLCYNAAMKTVKKIIILLMAIVFSLMLLLFGCSPVSMIGQASPRDPAETAAEQPESSAPLFSLFAREEPEETPEPTPFVDYSGQLRISEVMAKNKAALLIDGAFPDWVEIENISAEAVDLTGWTLSDRELSGRRSFSSMTLPAGGLLLVQLGDNGSFSLSGEETLYLFDPVGVLQDEAPCCEQADCSMARVDEGFVLCQYPTPAYPNTPESYDALCAMRRDTSPLLIDEVMVSNHATAIENGEYYDYVVVRNASEEAISLLGYTLSDKFDEPARWSFPDKTLGPGKELLLICDSEKEATGHNTGFSLDAASEQLYLFDPEGKLVDYIALHDIPIEGSMGRMVGYPGFFYFAAATPASANVGGCRRIAERPESATPEGVYNDCEGLAVALSAGGEIHYTTDGSLPTAASPLYTEPVAITQTTVLRAVNVQDGCITSRPATFSYIVNENHVLPVLSLSTDDPGYFQTIYNKGNKVRRLGANLTMFENDELLFNRDCSLSMKGWTSRELPKKSMGVKFAGRYGGLLEDVDIFGYGITEYASLSIRAGQDYTFSEFRNELFQDLCRESSEALLTQDSKYCILYINGRYWGVYCLKEDISRQYYASHVGVDVDTVDYMKAPFALGTDVMDLVSFTRSHNMNEDASYNEVDSVFNMASLIDWLLFESYSANTDTQGNLKIFRSPERGNKWELVYYDMDWAFYFDWASFTTLVYGKNNSGNQMPTLYANFSTNKAFRDQVFTRYAELCRTVLANDHVLELIDEYEALLEPEMPRDRERWSLTMDRWHSEVNGLRNWITDKDWCRYTINRLCTCFNVGASEKSQYFGEFF